jgi:3-oxoacyl-[acyl-carrier protein] reductase
MQGWLNADAAQHGGDIEAVARQMVRRANIVRIGEPEDIANLAAFILSPQGKYLQGSLVDMDGGQTKTV